MKEFFDEFQGYFYTYLLAAAWIMKWQTFVQSISSGSSSPSALSIYTKQRSQCHSLYVCKRAFPIAFETFLELSRGRPKERASKRHCVQHSSQFLLFCQSYQQDNVFMRMWMWIRERVKMKMKVKWSKANRWRWRFLLYVLSDLVCDVMRAWASVWMRLTDSKNVYTLTHAANMHISICFTHSTPHTEAPAKHAWRESFNSVLSAKMCMLQ